jgi:hypothetical protein
MLPVRAQAIAVVAPKFDIGYGPAMLFPASGGTPVFSAGDDLWVRSDFNQSVTAQVAPVGPNGTVYQKLLPPGLPADFLTFNSTSPQGYWVLGIVNSSVFTSYVVLLLSDAAQVPSGLRLASGRLVGNSLAMNFTTSPPLALYDGQACVFGNSDSSGVSLNVPSQAGSGSLTITKNGDTLSLAGQGLARSNFSLSLELYYTYSFLAPNSTTILLTRTVEIATAPGALVSGGNPLPSLTLRDDAPLKPGRYQLRAFFEGTGGVSLVTSELIISGGLGWVWLGACQSFPVYSNDFGVVVPLGSDLQAWPRSMWLTYTDYGEQGCAEVQLNLQLAAVEFDGVPWGTPLSTYRIDVTPDGYVSQAETDNGVAYMILDLPQGSSGAGGPAYLAYVHYTAGLGSRDFFSGTVGPIAPFTYTTVGLNVSRVIATYLAGGAPFEGGTVTLSDANGTISTSATNKAGQAAFYAPPGTYELAATGGNSSANQSVTLLPGQSLSVTLGSSGGSLDVLVEGALVAAAIVGVIANVFVFVKRRGSS